MGRAASLADEKVSTLVTVLHVGPDKIPQRGRELSSKQRKLCLDSPTIHSDSSWNGRPGLQRKERDRQGWEDCHWLLDLGSTVPALFTSAHAQLSARCKSVRYTHTHTHTHTHTNLLAAQPQRFSGLIGWTNLTILSLIFV